MRQINVNKQEVARALAKANETAARLAALDIDALEAAVAALDWQESQVAAVANTYFVVEALGTINAGEAWHIDATVGGSKKPTAAPTTRQATTARLIGSVTRPSTGGAASVAFTVSNDGGTLAGFGTGVRLAMNGNVVQLEARVTVGPETIYLAWLRRVHVQAIA
jgi:hypothetical protein